MYLTVVQFKIVCGITTGLDGFVEGREGHLMAQNASRSLAFCLPLVLSIFAAHTLKKYMRISNQLQEGKNN